MAKRRATLQMYCVPELRSLVDDYAERRKMTLAEVCTKAVAKFFGRPDLFEASKVRPGRPKREESA